MVVEVKKDSRSVPKVLRPLSETCVTRLRLSGSHRSQNQALDRRPEEGMCEKKTLEIVECVVRQCVPFLQKRRRKERYET